MAVGRRSLKGREDHAGVNVLRCETPDDISEMPPSLPLVVVNL